MKYLKKKLEKIQDIAVVYKKLKFSTKENSQAWQSTSKTRTCFVFLRHVIASEIGMERQWVYT